MLNNNIKYMNLFHSWNDMTEKEAAIAVLKRGLVY